MKRCGKSAPRVRQRNRQGKPHREQDRIGMATRVVRESDNARGSDVRLAIRVGCSRQRASVVPEEWPSRLVRRSAGGALQNPAYRPADVYHEGFGVTRRTPRHFRSAVALFALPTPYPRFIAESSTGTTGQGERLEPRIALHPRRHRAVRHCGCRLRLRGGKQRDIEPGIGSRRAAVQDHVRHHQRRHDHRPLHRDVRSAPSTCSRNERGHGPACSIRRNSIRHVATDRTGAAERNRRRPCACRSGGDGGG